jgi:hypothetical protein
MGTLGDVGSPFIPLIGGLSAVFTGISCELPTRKPPLKAGVWRGYRLHRPGYELMDLRNAAIALLLLHESDGFGGGLITSEYRV